MKIDRISGKSVTALYGPRLRSGGAPGPGATPAAQPGDALALSSQAREAARLRSQIKAAPEVRMDLVERIKARVEAGQYHVEPRAVADRILRSGVLDE